MTRSIMWIHRTPLRGSLLVLIVLAGAAHSAPPTQPNASAPAAAEPGKSREARQLDWDALLPPGERDRFDLPPPRPMHDYLGEGGPAATQQGSSSVNTGLNGTLVKIPGFIVPLELLPTGLVREMYLVPYFGACLHVPPPPPNQIVYVKMATPIKLSSMYDAVWVTGTLRTEAKTSRYGSAAYTLDANRIDKYRY
jgi:hypothetical protein